uniref:GPI ethanolamine phosphate transferase 2 n=1 Tax=Setaria digitata TaxID=48799 RepID=A0A915Q3T7_9BILA
MKNVETSRRSKNRKLPLSMLYRVRGIDMDRLQCIIICDFLIFAKQATLKLSQMYPRNRWVLLLLLCLSQIAIVSFFSSGFISKKLHSLDSDDGGNLSNFLNGCSKKSLLKKTLEKGTVSKMVIMVIDAWQERFFSRRKVMQFLHQLTSNGQAVAFTARLQIPTVTMPRIKAITAGVVPSFADIVNNFASSSISIDNIIDRLNDKGYRCTFCGDDTWLRLFPNRFDNHSAGVMSFYVNDFREVDDSVTLCMRARFATTSIKTWDLMILHYLGFDHIGHYLGGTHNEINNKLIEMDSIIKELYEKLHEIYSTNFSLIILGDHGMTESGNHGGPSELETLVPIVYVDGRKRTTNRNVLGAASVEQIDIVPTLATLFNVPIPKENLGVTLFPYIAFDHSNLSMLISVLQNIEQFRKLGVSSSKLNQCINRFYDNLQKYCSTNASQNIGGLIWDCVGELRKVQSKFLHVRTDINSVRLIVAIGLSTIVYFRNRPLSTYLTIFTQLLHPVAFFASSLIEEEHDIQQVFSTLLSTVIS